MTLLKGIRDYVTTAREHSDDVNLEAKEAKAGAKFTWLKSLAYQQLLYKRKAKGDASGGAWANLSFAPMASGREDGSSRCFWLDDSER